MSILNPNQKRLIFDYCFGLTTESDSVRAKHLITTDSEAAAMFTQINAALAPLETLRLPPCPDSLVEKTVSICCGAESRLFDPHKLEQKVGKRG